MSYGLLIKPQAEEDIQAAFLWYEAQLTGLGEELLAELDIVFELIVQFPEGFQKRYKQTRIAFLGRFPLGIHYMAENNTIVVLAVLHTSRNPQIWKG